MSTFIGIVCYSAVLWFAQSTDAATVPVNLSTATPASLLVSLFENPRGAWMDSSGVPWNARYCYFVKGWVNNGVLLRGAVSRRVEANGNRGSFGLFDLMGRLVCQHTPVSGLNEPAHANRPADGIRSGLFIGYGKNDRNCRIAPPLLTR